MTNPLKDQVTENYKSRQKYNLKIMKQTNSSKTVKSEEINKDLLKNEELRSRYYKAWSDSCDKNGYPDIDDLEDFIQEEIERRDDFWKKEIQQIQWDNAEAEEMRD